MDKSGLTTLPSTFSARETASRLVEAIAAAGMRVLFRVDHAANAASVGLTLRPTELIVFGTARGGTPLMLESQVVGIDLPLKALVWEDEGGRVWLTYNDASWLAERHALGSRTETSIEAIETTLAALAASASGA